MRNVTMRLDGSKLVIEVDLSDAANAPLSSSGKCRLVATTGGPADVPECPGIWVGLNVMAPK